MIPVRSKRLWHAVLAFLLLCSLIIAMWPGLTTAQNLDQSGQLFIPMEWDLQASVPNGANPYDVDGSVTFRHSSGATRTTGIFYDGDNTWKFRFIGDQTGQWSFTTESEISALDGQQGSVTVADSDALGFVGSEGDKWIRTGTGEAFVPQFVMYDDPEQLNPAKVDADINTFFNEHGFNGFHVSVRCRWFDIRHSSCSDSDSMNPDPRTFEALEMLITKTYEAGGTVHLWMYGDSSRKQNPTKGKGGLNNEADRRVQRYLAARLGPLPGWTMGYGYDVFEWANTSEVEQWHDYLQDQMGWEHYLGARYRKNVLGQWSDKLEYASYEQHRPSYDTYVETIEEYDNKPTFSEDRFRIRGEDRPKDYDEDDTRRGLWHSAMAGGVANIWGNLTGKDSAGSSSAPYSNAAQIKTYAQFFADRFTVDLERCNDLTDGVCLKRPEGQSYLFYKENTDTVQLDLSGAPGSIQAIAVDTKVAYEEIDVNVTRGEQTWQAPYTSDWALAIRTTGGPAPTNEPTAEPTVAPTQTAAPTNEPTAEPTVAPTQTAAPTNEPTAEPTATPPGSDQAYEAESSRNDLVGDSRVGNCNACSEGKRVQFVGSRKEGNNPWSGQLRFNEVTAATAGQYTLVIDYVNGSNRTRTSQLQINEASPIEISFPSRGTWRDIQVAQVEQVITLKAGSNRLTFSGETPGPDFDRIVVQSSGGLNPTNTAVVEPTDTPGLIRGLNGVEDGGSVNGTVAIEADVNGDNIAEVVFDLTGPEDKTHTERKRPYYFLGDRDVNGTREPIGWDTTTYPNGEYQLTVTATDNAGQSDSIEVNFSVDNNANPEPTATNEPLPTITPDPTAEPTTEPTQVPEPPVGGNNLPASAATYLGGNGDDTANAVDVAPNGNVLMAGVMPGHNPGGVTPTELLGGGAGAIVRLDSTGQEVLSMTRIGERVNDLEINNDGRVVACGDFGVATLNATASEVPWRADSGSAKRCSIGADGIVAAIVGDQAQVYNRDGDQVGSWSIGGSFQEDIAVDSANSLVIATGFTNKRGGGNPVQVAFIKAWRYNGQSAWTSYDFSGSDAARTSLMADTRGYRVTIGGDGKLYFAAESAGGNTIFTRDPDSIDQQVGDRQVKTDNYTNPFNTRSNHITWYGRYNSANGELEQGQIVLARLSSGAGNTIRPRGIDADANGTVYVSGVSACCIADRDNQQLGGQAIDGYSGGESFLLVASPNLRERLYWTPFPGGGDATVAVRNGQAAFATTANEDKLVTLNAIQDNPGNLSDAYLTVVE